MANASINQALAVTDFSHEARVKDLGDLLLGRKKASCLIWFKVRTMCISGTTKGVRELSLQRARWTLTKIEVPSKRGHWS